MPTNSNEYMREWRKRVAGTATPVPKACSKCQVIKSPSQFYKNKALKDGLDNYCKHCRRAQSAKTRRDNSE